MLEIVLKGNSGDNAYNNFWKKEFIKTCFMLDKDFENYKINEKT
ncbi:MAG: hypothetical protein RR835_12700 [Peptostreptococcaceae bacterium]